jgi:hypothetical protein
MCTSHLGSTTQQISISQGAGVPTRPQRWATNTVVFWAPALHFFDELRDNGVAGSHDQVHDHRQHTRFDAHPKA